MRRTTKTGAFRLKPFIMLVVLLATAAVFAGVNAYYPGPGYRAVYPDAKSGILFSHVKHKDRAGSCEQCHPSALKSRYTADRLLPHHEHCAECHKGAASAFKDARLRMGQQCLPCHEGTASGERPEPGVHPRANIHFSHSKHRSRGTKCDRCHRGNSTAGSKIRDLPDMRLCMQCHDGKRAHFECRKCHISKSDGRIVALMNNKSLKPPTWLYNMEHDAHWLQRHFRSAGLNSSRCSACHSQQYCLDCHAGRVKVRNVHPGDWLHLHSISGRMDNPRCRSCHRRQSFCIECHRRTGFAMDSPAGTLDPPPRRFHPSGWSQGGHRRDARRNIGACVSCHSEGSCSTCHARVNPHPSNWRSRCRALAKRNSRTCRRCHSENIINMCR